MIGFDDDERKFMYMIIGSFIALWLCIFGLYHTMFNLQEVKDGPVVSHRYERAVLRMEYTEDNEPANKFTEEYLKAFNKWAEKVEKNKNIPIHSFHSASKTKRKVVHQYAHRKNMNLIFLSFVPVLLGTVLGVVILIEKNR